MKKIKAAEVVLDFDLYPRNNIDTRNVRDIMLAMEAGVEMPPIIVDRKSRRCTDGFHRVRATLRRDKDGQLLAIEKDYPNEKEMFLDAVRLNASHGYKLDPNDRTHCTIIAERLHIPLDRLAGALNMPKRELGQLRETRTARFDSLTIPLKNTVRHMSGKRLTKEQMETNERLGGMHQVFYVNQVIMLIESKMLDKDNEQLLERLRHLDELLEGLLRTS